jgi:hypothetical protein
LYERKEWGEMGDSRIYNELVSIIKPIIARNDTPIFGRSQTGPRKIALEIALAQENDYKVDNLKIFEWDGECFLYTRKANIVYPDSNTPDFAWLFAFKLRQYRDNLTGLNSFLSHQIKANFNKDIKAFMNFIQRMFIGHESLLGAKTQKIKDTIDLWAKNYDPKVSNDPLFGNIKNWSKIEVALTDDQVRAYFSFLYLEKNNLGLPYLEKADTEKLLEFGFKVPPQPLPEKFRLNVTGQHKKSIMEICVNLLFDKFSHNLKNKLPFLKFLAFQFEDFKNYQSPKDFKNWSGNLTSKKLKVEMLPFKIQPYLDKIKAA